MVDQIKAENGMRVSMDYILTVDGQTMDASQEGHPLQFVLGKGQIIPGLERELLGMAVGEEKVVLVTPALGYGEYHPEAVTQVPRNRFPATMQLEAGMMIQMRGPGGNVMPGLVSEVGQDAVKVDLNHPLAGKELNFKVRIAALQAA